MKPIRIAVIGTGKIAQDQHLPSIAADDSYDLIATVSPDDPGAPGTPHFQGMDALIDSGIEFDAVSLCTPPQVRYQLASAAIRLRKHVFLEKPPGATLSEVSNLKWQAREAGVTLLASWHSRFAAGVSPAREWLADRQILSASIIWREDVRVWHPGQAWIWRPGGLGVFDPGINALSIITHILPRKIHLNAATLSFPANREAPIAADLSFRDSNDAPIRMDLDWRQTGPQSWDIAVETDAGTLKLSKGGAVLEYPGEAISEPDAEYPALYTYFAGLIRHGSDDVDSSPLRLVADAFLRGQREIVDPFHD